MRILMIVALLGLCTLTCKSKTEQHTENKSVAFEKKVDHSHAALKKYISVALNPKSESKVEGKVRFIEEDGVVQMTAKIRGLSKGNHAIHIHENSDCSSTDGTSAGGHWNPTAQPHGKWGAKTGFHKGDIGNFVVGDEEFTTVKFSTDQWCLGCGDETMDIIGKSVIIHQGEDDFISQPSGAAGSRVSCAGIIE